MADSRKTLNRIIRSTLPVLILGLAVGFVVLMLKLRPDPEKAEPGTVLPKVETVAVQAGPITLTVETQGTVSARTESVITPEVSGLIEWVAPYFEDGGFFEKGDILLRIDPLEYESRLAEARSRLAEARLALEREEAEAEQARQEWLELGRGEPTALVLRKPQLARAKAEVSAAQAGLDVARRNLEYTRVRAPYAGRILNKKVDVGQAVIARSTPLAEIYNIESVEVRLPVSSDELGYIQLFEQYRNDKQVGREPKVVLHADYGGNRYRWTGLITRTEGVIDTRSRLTYLVAEVENPYGLRENEGTPRPPLKVGQFVEAVIQGKHLNHAFQLPRSAVKPGDIVYVMDRQNRLESREVEVAKMDDGTAVITGGLHSGEKICLTPLLFFVEGMEVDPVDDDGLIREGGVQANLAEDSTGSKRVVEDIQ